jgi:tetratricopeptide (TPR) repeat protein
MGWWAAGGLLVVLILVVAWPILQPEAVAPVGVPATGAAGPAAVDLNSMTPREAADRLFQRVMQAASVGDSAQAAQFLPMAIQAYEGARPLDLHGLFDLSTLQRTAGDFAGARATADEGLAQDADHLLLLYAAAQAAQDAGETDAARGYYEHLLEVYDAESASDNIDYQAHSTMLPTARTDAQAFLGGA